MSSFSEQHQKNAQNLRSLTPQQINLEILEIWINYFKQPEYKVVNLTSQQIIILVSYYIYTAQNKTSLTACKKITPNDIYSAFLDCCMDL